MRKLLSFITLACLLSNARSQAPTLQWAKGLGGIYDDYSNSIAIDQSGNVYTTGNFFGTADFDPGSGLYNLTSVGYDDFFISKLNQSGEFLWAKRIGGESYEGALSITTDVSGIYITGFFYGTVDFDPGAAVSNLTGNGQDAFILKLDFDGNILWAKKMGGSLQEAGYCINTDAAGNVYTTGFFSSSTADFDPGNGLYNLNNSSPGLYEIYITKSDSEGNFIWAKSVGSSQEDLGYSIVANESGVYVTGIFNATADFDPGAGTFNLTSSGQSDIFILKLTPSGDFEWARSVGGSSGDAGIAIAADDLGGIYIAGVFTDIVDFNWGQENTYFISAGFTDGFILKADTGGNFVWVKSIAGPSGDAITSMTVDLQGNIYTTGGFRETVDFDPGAGIHNITAVGQDIFISALNASGDFIFAQGIGGTDIDRGLAICTDETGSIYLTGYFSGTIDFNAGTDTLNLNAQGYNDVFILKFKQDDVGIDYTNHVNEITVFPVPANEVVNLKIPDNLINSDITIFNSTGKSLFKGKAVNAVNPINISGFAPGIYQVILTNNTNTIFKRIIKL